MTWLENRFACIEALKIGFIENSYFKCELLRK